MDEYAIYFSDAIDGFNSLAQATLSKLNDDLKVLENTKTRILNDFENFKPFVPENFNQIKNDFQNNLDLLYKALSK